MAVFGVDFYGLSRYGSSVTVGAGYSVAPLSAVQFDFGQILVTWKVPDNSVQWTRVRIVRNLHGFPVDENDGDVVVDIDNTSSLNQFLDANLSGGRFYYYSAFIGANPPNWQTGFTYLQNEYITYGGLVYRALKTNVSIQPGTDITAWNVISNFTTLWYQAEGVSSLAVRDAGYTDFVYGLVPNIYKGNDGSTTDSVVDNTALKSFMRIFSFQMDTIRTEYDTLLSLNNPDTLEQSLIPSLAADLGVTLEPYVSPRLARMRVKTASFTHRQRGTAQGLRNLINVVAGWDCEVDGGLNLMLNRDQTAFDHPEYPFWTPEINYPTGFLVSYQSRIYACIAGAYGQAQAPTGTSGSNAYWTAINALSTAFYRGTYAATSLYAKGNVVFYSTHYYKAAQDNITNLPPTGTTGSNSQWTYLSSTPAVLPPANPDTGGYNSWGPVSFDATVVNMSMLGLLAGNPDLVNPTDFTGNALALTNNSGGAASIGVRSMVPKIGATSPDRGQVVKDGIPVPDLRFWNGASTYLPGDVVTYNGYLYQAVATNQNVQPDTKPAPNTSASPAWSYLGPQTQRVFAASGYTQVLTGAAVTASIFMEWYDEDGNLLDQVFAPTNITSYDDFSQTRALPNSVDLTGDTWTTNSSAWLAQYGYAYMDPTAVSQPNNRLAYINTGRANGNVGVTFRTAEQTGFQHGLLFRLSDQNNFWFVSRDWLGKCVAGTISYLTSWPTLVDGSRVVVNLNGNTITVNQYQSKPSGSSWAVSTLVTRSDSFNASATNHGLYERNQTP